MLCSRRSCAGALSAWRRALPPTSTSLVGSAALPTCYTVTSRHRYTTGRPAVRAASNLPSIFAVGTMDTKGDELNYLASKMRALGARVRTVDVSAGSKTATTTTTTKDVQHSSTKPCSAADISIHEVMRHHPQKAMRDASNLLKLPRAEAVAAVSVALKPMLAHAHAVGECSGVVGMGGSGGTSLISLAIQELPIGTPKIIVSTVAAGRLGFGVKG
mmetsp:Transcript_43270/g.69617  ORF Transcript_43270/g.69617 Transcript_43270/m.69617 type:complete len:216 (+) Transcript_43270:134-781(+)